MPISMRKDPKVTQIVIPNSPTDISTCWMREALAAGGVPNMGSLLDVAVENIGDGHGLFCETVRCRLIWTDDLAGHPRTVIVKLSRPDSRASWYTRKAELYRRENDYYRFVAPYSPIRSPVLFYGNLASRDYRSVLVLEDIGNKTARLNRGGDVSPEEAKIAIRAAARLHGRYWDQVASSLIARFPDFWKRHRRLVELTYLVHLPAALDGMGDLFSNEMRRLAQGYGPCIADHIDDMTTGPKTLTHGDFRLNNMFFDGGFAVIDWQHCSVRNGLFDVTQFLSNGVAPDIRRDIERELIEEYYGVVRGMGVEDLTLAKCWRDYRQIMLSALIGPVVTFGSMGLYDDRIRDRLETSLRRTLVAIQDLQAEEFLPNRRRVFSMTKAFSPFSRIAYRAYRKFP